MTRPQVSKSAQIRASLNHPIIDSGGQTIENSDVLAEYIKSESGSKTAERFAGSTRPTGWCQQPSVGGLDCIFLTDGRRRQRWTTKVL